MGSDQRRVFLAVVLSGVVLVVWQTFFAPKVSVEEKMKAYKQEEKVFHQENVNSNKDLPAIVSTNPVESSSVVAVKDHTLKNDFASFSFNNRLNIESSQNKNSIIDFMSIVGGKKPFQIQVLAPAGPKNISLDWNVDDDGKSIRGKDQSLDLDVVISLLENGRLNFALSSSKAHRFRFIFNSSKKELENNQMRRFVVFSKDVDRFIVGDSESGESKVKWFGVDFNFHLFAFSFEEKQMAKFSASESGRLYVDTIGPVNQLKGGLIFTKKDYDYLLSFGDKLELSVDFGFFYILAVPIMRGLQFFYKYIPNYGVAIILLTLLIRMITFPLQYKSFKSMKKMQKVQPELTKIKEKFKDDPQRMQKETMELFRRAGANPLGGCLPLLLQMPIFFAFYQVLYESVELLGAPFFGWISDLSQKDPFYVLPVLMSLSIFLQQKFQPSTTADPTQKKIMMLMPFFFGFIMVNVSSGLVLYIFVSTLFGMIQQYFVYRTTD